MCLPKKRSDHQIDIPISAEDHYPIDIPVFAGDGEEAKELYAKVMKEEWDDVIKMFNENKEIFQTAILITPRQTALHIAISSSLPYVVGKLLDNIDTPKIREMTDNRKENPLHLAASLGQLETCKRLVVMDPKLIEAQNLEGETPLFLAVLHGKKEAFYALHPKCPINDLHIKHAKAHCRRNDGNTILHVSIRGEYFQLAYQIIHWYPELINDVNEDGKTALHLLAENPSAFRSGCYLGRVDDIFYRISWASAWKDIKSDICKIFSRTVDRLPVKNTSERQETSNSDPQGKMYPYCKLCEHAHIIIHGDKTQPQMGPRIEQGFGVSTPQIQRASQMEKEVSTERPQYPSNCRVFLPFLRLAIELFLSVIGLGYFQVRKIKAMKLKHKLTYQIMKRLVRNTELWVYGGTGLEPDTRGAKESIPLPSNVPEDHSTEDQDEIRQDVSTSTSNNPPRPDGFEEKANISPILVAAKNGVVEIVDKILKAYPLAIYDEDEYKKNVFTLAAENRQLDIYNILRKRYPDKGIIFQKLDKDGNSAIHLAATRVQNQPWPIPGAALQMQWELKWYEFVRETMPHNIFRTHRNKEGMTSMEVFNKAHKTMLKEGVKWLTKTAQSCSVVAALVATVAYAAATTVPGGVEKGKPLLKNTYAFSIFTISSLVALCLSVTSLTMFLSILTSRNEISDFHYNLPMKCIMGLSSLFISIAAMLVSFCAGHFFDLADHLQHTAFPIYAVTCLPVSIYAATQFPLYFDLIYSIIMPVPKRNN